MAIASSSSIPSFGIELPTVAIGAFPCHKQHPHRQVCKKRQKAYNQQYRPPTPPKSRSRSCSRYESDAGLTSSMAGLSLSDYGSHLSRSQSQSTRTQSSALSSGLRGSETSSRLSRTQTQSTHSYPTTGHNSARLSRSQSQSTQRRPLPPPRSSSGASTATVRDLRYKPLVAARTTYDDSKWDDGRGRAPPPAPAPPARPPSRGRSQAGGPTLVRAPSRAGSVRGERGARSAGWVTKFVSGI